MRVGLLTTSFPRTPEDSAGSFVQGFARALAAHGCSCEVLAPEPDRAVAPGHERGVALHHVRYLRPRALQRTFYRAGAPENLARDPLAWLGAIPFSLALAREAGARAAGWDAIVSHWAVPCGLIAGRLRRSGRPHLAVLHSADVHALVRSPGRRGWARAIVRGADALWFVSEQHRGRFVELLAPAERTDARARSFAAPMGIELPVRSPGDRERARRALGLSRFTVLALGRLVPVKGLDVLLHGLVGLDLSVLIAGDGPERERLTRLARRLRLDARFVGAVAGSEKAALLTAADAFVASSRVLASGRSEGVPVALLEAMSYGLPVVASAVGGITEIVPADGSAGWLVPPEQPSELSIALQRLNADTEARSRAAAAARCIAENHSWNRVIQRALPCLGVVS